MEPITTLGTILEKETAKDAIHIAIAPVVAKMVLRPGQHVGIDGTTENPIGVVDPYLKARVRMGERFWMFLYPNTITGLRHEWKHPAFEPTTISVPEHQTKSHEWIANHAEALDLTVNALMGYAERWLSSINEWGDYTVQMGSEQWRDDFRPTEFWHHYEVVTGKVVPQEKKQSFFCCSC